MAQKTDNFFSLQRMPATKDDFIISAMHYYFLLKRSEYEEKSSSGLYEKDEMRFYWNYLLYVIIEMEYSSRFVSAVLIFGR